MARYIDADKIKYIGDTYTDDEEIYVKLSDVKKAIAQTPTADVVEVVRCKDCKQLKINTSNELYCKVWGDKCGDYCDFDADTELDNYCGYGERKDKQHGIEE